jgi:pimeloyl-ACP methyl ester carboxylesterase
MTEPQARITSGTETQARRDEPGAGERARELLLSGLPVAERQLDLNGVSTAVLEGGDGPPVVLLHGPGEHAAKWFQVLPDLVTTHRVVAPDLPGHGASDVIGGTLDIERVLGWLDDLIECTCPAPAALVGHVLGGAIAARFAVDRGERIRHLVLVDALGLAEFQPAPEFALALSEYISEPTEDAHDRLWSQCAFDLHAMRDRMGERWAWIQAYNLDRARAPGLKVAQEALMEQFGFAAISPGDLARMAVPTTLVWGRHDLATPVSVAQAASTKYGWPLRVIENAGDDPPMEQPEAFLEALRAALGSSSGARGPA